MDVNSNGKRPEGPAVPLEADQVLADRGGIVPGGVTTSEAHEAIDTLEQLMLGEVPVECPLTHRFTPGLYSREIFMPAGSLITSKIHRTEHPYVVSKGRCLVWIDGTGWVLIEAPHSGVTKPGTRRVLLILEDTVWTTFHPISEGESGDLEAIEARIIEPRTDHLELPQMPTAAELAALDAGDESCRG